VFIALVEKQYKKHFCTINSITVEIPECVPNTRLSEMDTLLLTHAKRNFYLVVMETCIALSAELIPCIVSERTGMQRKIKTSVWYMYCGYCG